MATEQGHQSRGGLKRHTKMRRGSTAHGSQQAMVTTFAKLDPSARVQAERIQRSRLRFAAKELGETSERTRVIEEWIDALDPLERENAELLLRQQIIDGRAAERVLDYDDAPTVEDSEELHGFLHAIHFDRPDDVWMLRAAQSRKHKFRNTA